MVGTEEAAVGAGDAHAGGAVVPVLAVGALPTAPRHVVEADRGVEQDAVARLPHTPVELIVLAIVHARVEVTHLGKDVASVDRRTGPSPRLHGRRSPRTRCRPLRNASPGPSRAPRRSASPSWTGRPPTQPRFSPGLERLRRPTDEVRLRPAVGVDLGDKVARQDSRPTLRAAGRFRAHAVGDHGQAGILRRAFLGDADGAVGGAAVDEDHPGQVLGVVLSQDRVEATPADATPR